MFATNAELQARIEVVMSTTLSAAQLTVLGERNTAAYNTIIGALVKRGCSKTQADTWVDGKAFQLDIAFYWLMSDLGWYKGSELEHDDLAKYNRVAELETVELLDSDGDQLATTTSGFGIRSVDLNDAFER